MLPASTSAKIEAYSLSILPEAFVAVPCVDPQFFHLLVILYLTLIPIIPAALADIVKETKKLINIDNIFFII
jgi:hypothetical protein